jgi:integrase
VALGYLTQAKVNHALAQGDPVTLRDGNGLLFIHGRRKVGWYAEYRMHGLVAGQRQSRQVMFLAHYAPTCRLAEARKLNAAAQLRVADGHDVLAERKATRAETIKQNACTVGTLIDMFVKARSENWRPTTMAAFRGDLCTINHALGPIPVRAVTRAMLVAFLQAFVDQQQAKGLRATRAERVKMLLGAIFNHAFDLELIQHLPTTRLKLPVSTRVKSRERVLDAAEIAFTWHALEQIGTPLALAAQLSLATGGRIGAVILAHESELDLQGHMAADSDGKPLWRLPGTEGRKAPGMQVMPLSAVAVGLWKRALEWPARNPGGVVFPGRVAGQSLRPTSLSSQWADWVRMELLPAGTTAHDLRRTARSWWSGLDHGQTRDVMERLLGHSVGGKVERVYDRSLHLPQQRRVADAWGTWLAQVVEQSGG